jgi:hypothetical protein
MTQDQVLDKVRKLLRLATSTNAHEAARAAEAAQRLIDQHNLDTMLLTMTSGAAQPEPDEPIQNFRDKGAPLADVTARWQMFLASAVARANSCRIYYMGHTVHIVGRASHAETVRYLYAYLESETNRLARIEGKGCGRTWTSNYRLGVVETLSRRLRESATSVARAAQAEHAHNPAALALVNTAIARIQAQGTAVDAWMRENMRLRSGRRASSTTYDASARERGRRAGESIGLTGSGRAIGASLRALHS